MALYNQTVQLIELTKELERIPVDTLTSTYALGHTYKNAGNYISAVKSYRDKASERLEFLELPNVYKNIAQGKLNLIAQFGRDFQSGTLTILPTVEVKLNDQVIYNKRQPAGPEGRVFDTIDLSNKVGTITITYIIYHKIINTDWEMYATYTLQAIQDIPNENKRSVTDVINRVLDVGVACRTQNEKPFYKLDPVYAEMFSKIPAPEYTFTRATLYEVLLEIGTTNNLGAIPSIRLHYSQTHQQSYAIYLRFESSIRLHYSQTA